MSVYIFIKRWKFKLNNTKGTQSPNIQQSQNKKCKSITLRLSRNYQIFHNLKLHWIVTWWLYISIWLKQEMYNSSLSNLRPIKGVRTLKVERHNFQIFWPSFTTKSNNLSKFGMYEVLKYSWVWKAHFLSTFLDYKDTMSVFHYIQPLASGWPWRPWNWGFSSENIHYVAFSPLCCCFNFIVRRSWAGITFTI